MHSCSDTLTWKASLSSFALASCSLRTCRQHPAQSSARWLLAHRKLPGQTDWLHRTVPISFPPSLPLSLSLSLSLSPSLSLPLCLSLSPSLPHFHEGHAHLRRGQLQAVPQVSLALLGALLSRLAGPWPARGGALLGACSVLHLGAHCHLDRHTQSARTPFCHSFCHNTEATAGLSAPFAACSNAIMLASC